MSHIGGGYDINQTFIIEPFSNDVPMLSACTGMYTNAIISCSGDTQIIMSDGIITFDGNLYTNDSLTANTINASTYFSGGTNMFDIINELTISGGTFNQETDTLTLVKGNNSVINVSGFSDYYTTGTTVIGNTVYFNRNDMLSAYTLDFTTLTVDVYATGVTFNDNQLLIVRNDGVVLDTFINSFTGLTINGILQSNSISATTISADTFFGDGSNLTGISTKDTYVTGGTYSNGTTIFINNSGGTFNIDGYFTGGTNQFDVFVTGATYSNGTATFTNNTGGTFNLSGLYTNLDDVYTTGFTVNNSTYDLTIFRNDGISFSVNLGILASDISITGGTYNPNTGVATFTNTSGGTFNVDGFLTGQTDTYVTGLTYSNNILTLNQTNNQADISVLINTMSGLTVNGSLSATTYLGLPTDVYVTGGTYSNGVAEFTNNTGGTFSLTGLFTGGTDVYVTGGTYNAGTATFVNSTGGTFNVIGFSTGGGEFSGGTVTGETVFTNGLSANTFSATTYLGLPIDVYLTGATYSAGTAVFTNNTGGTFSVGGLFTGGTDVYVTGGTYNAGTATFVNSTGGTFNVSGLFTGGTDVYVTGGTYNAGTAVFTNNTGGTFNVVGFSTGGGEFSGGTVTGPTIFTNGLTANTFSATTYLGLPTDVYVTGGTYSAGTINLINSTGGTFDITGLYTGTTTPFDVYVTGATYSAGTAVFTNNTGGTFNVSGYLTGEYLPLSGGTMYGDITLSSDTAIKSFSGGGYLNLNISGFSAVVLDTDNGSFEQTFVYLDDNTIQIGEGSLSGAGISIQKDVSGNVASWDAIYVKDNTTYTMGTNDVGKFPVIISSQNANIPTGLNNVVIVGGQDISALNSNTVYVPNLNIGIVGSGASINNLGIDVDGNIVVGEINISSTFTGGTVSGETSFTNGLTSTTISATTYLGLPTDVYVSGGTYSDGTIDLINTTGGTIQITGLFTGGTSGTDIYVTGGTYNAGTATFTNNTGGTFNVTGFETPTGSTGFDVFVTGGTYNSGTTIFTNNTGGTFSVSGYSTGGTVSDTYVTGFTYNNSNVLTIKQNQGQPDLDVAINTVTGLTINGMLSATTISATTYLNLPTNASDAYIFSSNNSDIGGYEQMVILPLYIPNAIASIVTTVSTTPTLLANFATNLNYPNTTVIPNGVVTIHFETEKNTGGNAYECFAEIYKRNLAGTETLIGTSDLTSQITTNVLIQQLVSIILPTNITILTTDRIVVKIYANVISGVNRDITLFYDDATNSRLELPATNVSIVGLVPYTGATTNVDLGNNNLTANNITATTISATTYLGLSLDGLDDVNVSGATDGQVLTYSAATQTWVPTTVSGGTGTVPSGATTGSFGITIDGLGGVISSGQKGYVSIPYNATITGWDIFSDLSGTCVVDVWKDSYVNFPPTVGDSIAGTQKPTLSGQRANRNNNLSGWSTNISAGDVIGFNVEASPTGTTRVNLIIKVTKS